MQTEFQQLEDLPKLAWLAEVDLNERLARVRHGSWVETGASFLAEGLWAGPFEQGDFQDDGCFFGSGLVIGEREVTLVPSAATTDFLYYRHFGGNLVASNSLPLLLAGLGDCLDARFPGYVEINRTIMDGIEDYRRDIPATGGGVRRLMYNNLRVTPESVNEQPKRMPPSFGSYSDYAGYLSSRMKALFDNARSTSRRNPMAVFSTQSKGYDSTAVNSIGAQFGIDRVFTCPESKEAGAFYRPGKSRKTESDDGTTICRLLGLESQYIDRRGFERDTRHELLFHAGMHENEDRNLQQIFDYVTRPSVLLTGVLGELWYTQDATPPNRMESINDKLKRWDLSGHGLSEVRLHVGFVHLPVPFIGARRRADIMKITESAEMDRWRLGGSYDRPIPRRIGEEAGIPRDLFGQLKLASIVHFPVPNFPYDASLRREFARDLIERRLVSRPGLALVPLLHAYNNWIYWKNPQRYFYNRKKYPWAYYLSRAFEKLGGGPIRLQQLGRHLDGSLYRYAVNQIAEQYSRELVATGDS